MTRIGTVVLPGAMLCACATAPALPPAADAVTSQVLAGRWMSPKPEPKCIRYVEFRADGTMTLVDGAARIDATYRLASRPTAKGMYKLDATVIRENVGKDCAGNTSVEPIPPGLAFDMGYVWLDASKSVFMMCEQDGYAFCREPMQRLR